MFEIENPVLWLLALVTMGAVILLGRRYLNAEARERRRRDRSHGRVISKARRPMVKLAVDEKERKD